jgi:cyclomaltodextrinase / maltogenic alpha-amylase / neopullulanase
MARQTDLALRNQTIYQVFPRQYSKEGTLKALTKDLDRIASLGVTILYLLPVHPIGVLNRKGAVGSPYSIVDYYAISPDLGTMQDFDELVNQAHEKGLKVMMDIVFNHTSRDSILTKEHPEWFFKNEDGSFANRVGDWSDITDFNFEHRAQWNYLIDNLVFWAKKVDGFRCDVAPLVPLDFWKEAREAVEKVSKHHIWLTESVHPFFIQHIRRLGHDAHSDGEMYQVFDIGYDYDIDHSYHELIEGIGSLSNYLTEVEKQDFTYPKNYIKLRAYENHDKPRLRPKLKDDQTFYNMLSMSFFLKGTPMLYNGVEVMSKKDLTLFEKDPINWEDTPNITPFIQKLVSLKKDPIMKDGHFYLDNKEGAAVMHYETKGRQVVGIFNVENMDVISNIPLEDGTYINALNQQPIIIKNHTSSEKGPVWIIR